MVSLRRSRSLYASGPARLGDRLRPDRDSAADQRLGGAAARGLLCRLRGGRDRVALAGGVTEHLGHPHYAQVGSRFFRRRQIFDCKQGYFGRTGNGTIPKGPRGNYPDCYKIPGWTPSQFDDSNKKPKIEN